MADGHRQATAAGAPPSRPGFDLSLDFRGGTSLAEVPGVVTLEDFTGLSAGSDVPGEGFVRRCPKCGRNGVVHEEPDSSLCIHVQESEVLADGMLTEPRDCCRLLPIAGW